VQFPSGSEQLAFEQFFEENEKYPIITVGNSGGNFTSAAFNDVIDIYDQDTVDFGDRSQKIVIISDTQVLKVQVPTEAYDETIRGVQTEVAWTGVGSGGDDITVELYSDYQTSPTLVASASLPGTTSTGVDRLFGEFNPYVALDGSDYWVTYQTSSGSSYYICVDTDATTQYKYDLSGVETDATGSINGSLILPVVLRMGTNYEGTMTVRCSSKNDSKSASDLAELIVQYFTLAKHAQISRQSTATNGMLPVMLNSSLEASEFTKKGIYIRSIRQGAMENRKRGENDNIFTFSVTIDVFTEWHQDYSAESIKEITINSSTFSEEESSAVIN